jgi:stringent starvation protein B
MLPSSKPYLIRAIYEWCNDNGFAPYLAVSVDAATKVPRAFVKDGEIVLNIGPEATQGLVMGNDEICFQARFNGAAQSISVPVARVLAIYARENGQGMAFEVASAEADASDGKSQESDEAVAASPVDSKPAATPPPSGRPHLTRIK